MQLEPNEERLVQKCRKEEQSWRRWSLAFSVTGYLLIGAWLVMGAKLDFSVTALAAAFYLIETGINERREHSLRQLVLKIAGEK